MQMQARFVRKRFIFIVVLITLCCVFVFNLNPDANSSFDSLIANFSIKHILRSKNEIIPEVVENYSGQNIESSTDPTVSTISKLQSSDAADPDAIYKNTPPVWTFKCKPNVGCIRASLGRDEVPVEVNVCWLTCQPLWPYPKKAEMGQCLTKFSENEISLMNRSKLNSNAGQIMREMFYVFSSRLSTIRDHFQTKGSFHSNSASRIQNTVSVNIKVSTTTTKIQLDTDESYSLTIQTLPISLNSSDCTTKSSETGNETVQIEIVAITIYGARNALETLLQLITFDPIQNDFQIVNSATISDAPVFKYRGLLVDTARNFIPISNLKRVIDGMSINKLNVFHWHITDSNSFPFYSKSVPQMTKYGAYNSPEEIYYPNDVKDLVRYALVRGVKILPELDAPAHAGHGWQWGESEGMGNLCLCLNVSNWRAYCGQPPCGQLNPLNPMTYTVLEKLYYDFLEAFDDDLFHMGGDEVYSACWQTDEKVAEWIKGHEDYDVGFLSLWGKFQKEALRRLKMANNGNSIKAVLWSSTLVNSIFRTNFTSPEDYYIQVWDGTADNTRSLLMDGYKVIMSNTDSLYLDWGGGTWLGREHVYAYKDWFNMYDNRLDYFMPTELKNNLVSNHLIGSEACLWSEKINFENLDGRIWPRGAALGENLWSNPLKRESFVYSRLNHHNRRLISLGIRSAQLQPESCYLLSGHCEDPNSPM